MIALDEALTDAANHGFGPDHFAPSTAAALDACARQPPEQPRHERYPALEALVALLDRAERRVGGGR